MCVLTEYIVHILADTNGSANAACVQTVTNSFFFPDTLLISQEEDRGCFPNCSAEYRDELCAGGDC